MIRKSISILIVYLLIDACNWVLAQNYSSITIYTPNGHSVAALSLQSGEMSSSNKREARAHITSKFPDVIIVDEPTYSYNCHGYAWNVSEGGTACWINQYPDLHWYWDDNSYIETTSQYGTKVFYSNGDHSAIKSTTYPGYYESKWGYSCRVIHSLYNTDYVSTNLKFYAKKPVITSNDRMIGGTESGTYEVSCIIKDTNLSWVYDTNLVRVVSSSGNRIVLQPKTTTSVGDMTLTAQFKNASGQTVHTCSFYVGIGGPHYRDVSLVVKRSSDGSEVYPSGAGLASNSYYYAYLSASPTLTNVIWNTDTHLQNLQSNNSMMYFKTDSQGWGMLSIYGTASRYGISKKLLDVTLYGGY